jgi:hypothetical protein
MTAKEKATIIYNKILKELYTFNCFDGEDRKSVAKDIALILVDEIIDSKPTYAHETILNPETLQDLIDDSIEYFNEVKKEIKLL